MLFKRLIEEVRWLPYHKMHCQGNKEDDDINEFIAGITVHCTSACALLEQLYLCSFCPIPAS